MIKLQIKREKKTCEEYLWDKLAAGTACPRGSGLLCTAVTLRRLCSAEQLSPQLACSHPDCSLASHIPHVCFASRWRPRDPCLYLHSRPSQLV